MGPEDIVVEAVVTYFSSPRFKQFSIKEEYSIQIGSYKGRADVALIDEDENPAAIIECKRSGYEGSGPDQLKSYLSATDTPLGVFANEIDSAAWKFYENRGQSQFNEISRSRFERQLLKTGTIERFADFVRSFFRRQPDTPPPTPPPDPTDSPTVPRDPPQIIHVEGGLFVQNNSNTNLDPTLNGKPYYSEASGFYWAANHDGMPECVPQHVKHIISNEELEIKSTREQLQEKIDRLIDEKNRLVSQKREYEQEIEQRSQNLARKREELAGLEVQLQAPTEIELARGDTGEDADDNKLVKQSKSALILQSIFPTLTTVALIGLLCYLFVFYASAGDKAFSSGTGSVQQQLNEIVNHAALFQAWEGGNWFVVLFPFIFLVLAILTHLSIEHKQWVYMGLLLIATFAVDSIIAIKISQRIHDDKVVRGILEELEKWTIADLNILAVLLLGFAVSLLLSYGFYWTLQLWKGVGSLRYQSKEQEIRAVQIENEKVQREAQIAILKTGMENLQKEIDPLNEKAKAVQQGIDQGQAKIEELLELRHKRFVNGHQIESRVSQFLKGWYRFVVHSEDGKTDVSAQIDKIKQVADETINQYYEGSQEYSYQS